MKGRLALCVTALAIVACSVSTLPTIPACAQLGGCSARVAGAEYWGAMAKTIVLLLGGATMVVWSIRMLTLGLRSRQVRQLPTEGWPKDLREAVGRVGAGRVVCIASELPLAFCAGIVRPRIYVSRGLIDKLRPSELDAVLLHELYHRHRRDPLRYAAAAAVTDVCFYLPVLGWIARYLRENAELGADRAAMKAIGNRPVAGALWALGEAADSPLIAAFAGTAELRAAQILGDPLPRRRPRRSLLLASAIGALALLAIAGCMAELLPIR